MASNSITKNPSFLTRPIKFDRNISFTGNMTERTIHIDLDKTEASTSSNTIIGIDIDMDNATATDGSNSMYGIRCFPTLTHAADAGTAKVYGLYALATGSSNGGSTAYGGRFNATGSDTCYGLYVVADAGVNNAGLKIVSSASATDYFKISCEANGETDIVTFDTAELAHLNICPDGDTTIDRNVTLTDADSYYGLNIDFDKTGTSTSDNTLYGLRIDADNITATNGTNTMYGIHCAPSLQHNADAGTVECIGGYFKAQTGTNGTTTSAGVRIDQSLIGDTKYGLQIRSTANTDDFFAITLAAEGATTISTVDDDTAIAHLTLDVDGDIILDPVSGITKFYLAGDTDDYTSLTVSANGATELRTFESGSDTDGHLTLKPEGDLILDTATGITKFQLASDADDLCTLTVAADGVTTIATADSDGAVGHLTLDVDGDIILDPVSGITKFYDAGDSTEYASLTVVGGTGATTLATASEAADGHLTANIDGNILLGCNPGGAITLQENDGTTWTPSATSDATTKAYVDLGDVVKTTEVTLSEADMNDLHNTAITLVAAQGSGKVVLVTSCYLFVDRDTSTTQSSGSANLLISWNAGDSYTQTAICYIRRFMYNETGDRIWKPEIYNGEIGQSLTAGDNQPLTVVLDGAVTSGSIDSMKVVTTYHVYDNS